MTWNATQYAKFEAERNRPIHDLLAQLAPDGVTTAVDLGCGPGNSTELLQHHCPGATVTGVDSSPDMIAAARKRLPDTRFEVADIAGWQSASGPSDLVFANASLQWVPDHARLMPALLAQVRPGGCLAVQIPDNGQEAAHRLMREIAQDGPWAAKLTEAPRRLGNRQTPDWYLQTLRAAGAEVDMWRTTYFHQLAGGTNAIVEWFRATGLRPFIDPLDEAEREMFLARYRAAVAESHHTLSDGTAVLPMPRLFFVARR